MITIRTNELDFARRAAGLTTNAKLGQAMGLTESAVSRVLNGKRGVSPDFIVGLRRAFPHVPVEQLINISADPELPASNRDVA